MKIFITSFLTILLLIQTNVFAQKIIVAYNISDIVTKKGTREDIGSSIFYTHENQLKHNLILQYDLEGKCFFRLTPSIFTNKTNNIKKSGTLSDSVNIFTEIRSKEYGLNASFGRQFSYQKFDFYAGVYLGIVKPKLYYNKQKTEHSVNNKIDFIINSEYNTLNFSPYFVGGFFASMYYNIGNNFSIGFEMSNGYSYLQNNLTQSINTTFTNKITNTTGTLNQAPQKWNEKELKSNIISYAASIRFYYNRKTSKKNEKTYSTK